MEPANMICLGSGERE